MKVRLLVHTPEPEKVIATAAKMCYSAADADELMEGLTPENTKKFLDLLFSLGHESPIEHVTYTFIIEDISRACSHQLVRHRIASYSQKSQRYVNEEQFDYVTPPEIEDVMAAKLKFEDAMMYAQEAYDEVRRILIERNIRKGMDRKDAEKLANEDARFILPNACTTAIVVTMNIRSLFNFFKLRCCNRAQWEIRDVAMEMYKLAYESSPTIFSHAGPGCVTDGHCSEGKMCCGKFSEKIAEFDNLKK